MLNSTASRSVLACAAAALGVIAALAPASAATAASPSWHIVKQINGGGGTSSESGFTAVTAAGRNTIWAFTSDTAPAAWRRTGTTWKKFGVQGPVSSASATSPGNVWAITQSGKVLHWNGAAWAISHVFAGSDQVQALGPRDVWVFGTAWEHYNGHTWTRVTSAHGLEGASVLSDNDIWSFGQSTIAHWNGHTLTRTSVKKLLVAKNPANSPELTGIYAQSKNSIWAIGTGDTADAGGPLFILHDNGQGWRRVVVGQLGSNSGTGVAPDGSGGLWIPLQGASGQAGRLAHFSHGKLTFAKLPVPGQQFQPISIAPIPGTTQEIVGAFTHNPGFTKTASVVLQYS